MRRCIRLALALGVCLTPLLVSHPGQASVSAQPDDRVAAIMARLTPAQKVGQLFLVSFYGPSAAPGTDIERLVTQHHVGGVVLLASNDNITDTTNAPLQVLTLANELQAAAASASEVLSGTPPAAAPPFIPLFVAVQHEGDGYPFSTLRSGLTHLPNAMAIGATWDPRLAEEMGRIAGRELAALGINLLLGPSLDVLDTPRPQGSGDLGTRAFGGDPYWVGLMGRAYIRGVHAGAEGDVAVIAGHFPGSGGSERNPEEEVPTVRKSLEQLKQVELAPFFAVTGNFTDTDATTDALLTAHIRFQGFQGNIRQTTSPVSFDQQALGQLLALPDLAAWRANGGVTVSESLGVRAVKRFYDPNLQTFNNRRIAREAFEAGNDLLMLSDFGLNPRVDQTSRIVDTITFFVQQYEEDDTFAAKVDAAVARLLQLKLRLYGDFDPAVVQRPEDGLNTLGQGDAKVRALAQASATLIGLTPDELEARVPEAPVRSERIVFFTDTRAGRQCPTCPAFPLIERRALERAVVQAYGPAASNQVNQGLLQSFTFEDLAGYLAAAAAPAAPVGEGTPTPEPSPVETALAQADWVVFSMLSVTPEVPSSGVVSTFLAQRPDLVRTRKVIVFAFNAPYYLDTTDVSKLTAYYALYSKAPAFIDTAARLLFRGLSPVGASPVSVPSVGYDLSRVTAPDPAQVIQIFSQEPEGAGTATPQPEGLKVGDTFPLRTGVILDHNGHPVPDGTVVRFMLVYQGDDLPAVREATTSGGVASTEITLNRTGVLEITAMSEPALNSFRLQLNVQPDAVIYITVIAPTATDTPTPEPVTPTPEPPSTATPTPPATPTGGNPPDVVGRVSGRDFVMMCLGLMGALVVGYRFGSTNAHRQHRVRVALSGAIGVLAGYNWFALGLPGADLARQLLGVWAASACVLAGAVVGLAAGWYGFSRQAPPHA